MDHIPVGHNMFGEVGYHCVIVLLQSAFFPFAVVLNLTGNYKSIPPLSPV